MIDPVHPYNIENMNIEELKTRYRSLESQHKLTSSEATEMFERLTAIRFALEKITPENWPRIMGLANDLVNGSERVAIIQGKWKIT